jgi:hypothetical protein
VTLEELSEMSNDKEDMDARVTRKSRLGRNDYVASRVSTASEDRPCDATDESGRRFGGDYCATAQVLLWALRPAARLWIPLLKTWRYRGYSAHALV